MVPANPAIFAFLLLASVFGAPTSETQQELETFTLYAIKTPPNYNGQPESEVLLWNPQYTSGSTSSAGGPLGWGFEQSDKAVVLRSFVQFNAKKGIVFDYTDTSRTIVIRRSGQVVLGSLAIEEGARESNWTISESNMFGFENEYGKFKSCKGDGKESFSLYYETYPNTECKSITIVVNYDK